MTLILGVILWAASLSQAANAGPGRVEGVVVDADNKPIKGASVYADNLNLPLPARHFPVLTNDQGQFVLEDVTPGHLVIRAYKQADMYPDPLGQYFQFGVPSTMPQLELKAGEVVKGIEIRLDKKAASLQLHVLDAVTNEPMQAIEYQMCHADHPGDRMFCITGSHRGGEYQLFVPSGVPILIKVSAPNHQEWRYQDAAKKPYIVLASGEERTLTINLQRPGQ
jgi:Carboxypeptidase regulatory-like domain